MNIKSPETLSEYIAHCEAIRLVRIFVGIATAEE
jgi:hypothetical protein